MNDRVNILVIGPVPVNDAPFVERNLSLKPIDLTDLTPNVLSDARGLIISDRPGQFRNAAQFFGSYFEQVGAFGLLIAVQTNSDSQTENFDNASQISKIKDDAFARLGLSNDSESDRALVLIGQPLKEVAEKFARHDPGPRLGDPKLIYIDLKLTLSAGTELLLKRAFSDCSSVAIEPLAGGKRAKATLRIHATFKNVQFGKQGMPFFFKHGNRREIEKEKNHYRRLAEPFIPFHLRPALSMSRSVSTFTEAVIVGNFVEGGTPLREAMRTGQGTVAIFSLFEVTLRRLRAEAMRSEKGQGFVHAFLKNRVRAHEIVKTFPDRIKRAAAMGFRGDVLELEAIILSKAKSMTSHHGMAHGDCHAGNVLIRQRDAVLIDFGSVEDLPLSVDPAILEVSLVFQTDKHDDAEFREDWLNLVRALYLEIKPEETPQVTDEHARYAWLLKAVRELRHIVACNCSPGEEYRLIVAGALIRFARLSASDELTGDLFEFSEDKRAFALVIAQNICDGLK